MISHQHLTEQQIQDYAIDPAAASPGIARHVRSCAVCREQVEGYVFLFQGISEQPQVIPDKQVTDLVMSQLRPYPSGKFKRSVPAVLLIILGVFFALVIVREFGPYIIDLFSGIVPLIIYLLLITVGTSGVVLCFDLYTSYRSGINRINSF